MIAVILWMDSGEFTVATMPKWLIQLEPDACNVWVNYVLNMGWSLWAFCI
jgi:hypothetical protein